MSTHKMSLKQFANRIRTDDNADVVDWFARCTRDEQDAGSMARRLTIDDWREAFDAWWLVMRIMGPAVESGAATVTPAGKVVVPLDPDLATELAHFGRGPRNLQ